MALSETTLKILSKDKIMNLTLEYYNKINSTWPIIRGQLSDLKWDFESFYLISIATHLSTTLKEKVTGLESDQSSVLVQ